MDALSLLPDYQKLSVESRSRLVIITAQRARQLMQGARPALPTRHTKPTTIALEEMLNGKIHFLVGKEAQKAMKEARKQRERELEKLTMAQVAGADAAEIKKDLSVVVDDSKPAEASEDD
ncbi:MAG: DNA-directed RNA polymerase subunit omega [Nitrospiraceae bacterium]|nr:MAG: DNA-directed RNA polymerase subunit omega [Nitrospiraceae bacterium]